MQKQKKKKKKIDILVQIETNVFLFVRTTHSTGQWGSRRLMGTFRRQDTQERLVICRLSVPREGGSPPHSLSAQLV